MTIIELRNKLNKFIDEQSNQEINHMPITFIRYSQPESKKIEDNVGIKVEKGKRGASFHV